MIRHWRACALVLAVGAASVGLCPTVSAQKADKPDWEAKPYTVLDGKVDMATYNGYRRYDNRVPALPWPRRRRQLLCALAGQFAQTDRLREVRRDVVFGKKDVSTSQQLVMPAFGEVEDVVNNLDDIYTYPRRAPTARSAAAGPNGWRNRPPDADAAGLDMMRAAAIAVLVGGMTTSAWAQVGELTDRPSSGSAPIRAICRSPTKGRGFREPDRRPAGREARGAADLHLVPAEHRLRAQDAQCRRLRRGDRHPDAQRAVAEHQPLLPVRATRWCSAPTPTPRSPRCTIRRSPTARSARSPARRP